MSDAGIPAQLETAAARCEIPLEPSERFVCDPVVHAVALGEAPVSQNQRMRQGVLEPHRPGSRPPMLTHAGTYPRRGSLPLRQALVPAPVQVAALLEIRP